MSADLESQVRQLLDLARGMPEGAAKRAVFDEAINAADVHRHDLLGYEARMTGLWSIYENGDIRLLFAHYAWCLAASDRNPDWDRFKLLWRYRWVIDSMPDTPDISRPQIEDALADMTRRYLADGFTERAILVLKRRVYEYMGDREKEAEAFDGIRRHRRDQMSDSVHAESTFAVDHLTFQRRYGEAARTAETTLAKLPPGDHYAGALQADMLVPLLTVGELDRAARYHRNGLRTNQQLNRSYGCFGGHASYLTLVGDLPAAAELAAKHLPSAAADPSLLSRFDFFHVVRLLCDRIAKAGLPATLKPPPQAGLTGDRVPFAELVPYLDRELTEIAQRLDARNGNEYYRRVLPDDLAEWNALADRLAAGTQPKPDPDRNFRVG